MTDTTRVRAIYGNFRDFKRALAALKDSGIEPREAFGPVNLAEMEEYMPGKGSTVRIWATVWAIIGLVSFWYMCVASSLLYSLVVGGKPPVSNVPFVIISYEGTILLGSIAAFISVLAIAKLRPRKLPSDYSPRFSGSEFGIEVQLKEEQKAHVIDILRKSGAQEIDEPG